MTTIKASGRDLELRGDQDIVFYPTDNIWISQGTKLIFEGTVPDDHEAKLQATAVTADRDIIIPDASGTITLNEKLTDGTFDMNVNSLTVTGAGSTSVIQAAQDIELDATGAVIVKDTPLRLASLTTTQRNALTPTNGDMIYNTTTNQFEIYRNGAWETNATTESLVDSAPSTLDTLNELAAALGDDPNFATTVTNNIATKVSKAGDTMTGLLTLSGNPTANLHAATKQYVDSEITANSGGSGSEIIYSGNGSQTLNPGDTAVIKLLGDLSGNSVGTVLYRNGDNNDRLINNNYSPSAYATYTNNTGSAITGVGVILLNNAVNHFWFIDRA